MTFQSVSTDRRDPDPHTVGLEDSGQLDRPYPAGNCLPQRHSLILGQVREGFAGRTARTTGLVLGRRINARRKRFNEIHLRTSGFLGSVLVR